MEMEKIDTLLYKEIWAKVFNVTAFLVYLAAAYQFWDKTC